MADGGGHFYHDRRASEDAVFALRELTRRVSRDPKQINPQGPIGKEQGFFLAFSISAECAHGYDIIHTDMTTVHFISFHYFYVYGCARYDKQPHHHARATNISGSPGHAHVNSQAEEQPHRVSTWDLDSSHRSAIHHGPWSEPGQA